MYKLGLCTPLTAWPAATTLRCTLLALVLLQTLMHVLLASTSIMSSNPCSPFCDGIHPNQSDRFVVESPEFTYSLTSLPHYGYMVRYHDDDHRLYSVRRRYSDFEALESAMAGLYLSRWDRLKYALPPHKPLYESRWQGLSLQDGETRRRGLESFLNAVNQDFSCQRLHRLLQMFIDPNTSASAIRRWTP